ncbi:iron-containing alcohol dehydrogenase [Muricomes intestini]|uniref:iron-containing alcohol dehydrogenase n=1 Tax=Muricomes intestini TaxID=1796634 RepID=UPI002FE199A6
MLNNFEIRIGTQFIFGRNVVSQVGKRMRGMGIHRVLIHHDGGKFLYDSGILNRIKESLQKEDIYSTELAGVRPNPRLSLVRKGIELAKREKVDLIFAVGGGSVIDSAKAIAMGAATDDDVWDYFTGAKEPVNTLPVAAFVTYPAAGSESSAVAVINNAEEGKKLLGSNEILRPAIAFMQPELTSTLPDFLSACGIVDMFSHVCERYFSPDEEIGVIDRMAEGILKTIVAVGSKVLREPDNYSCRAELMWIATIAQNNTVGIGRVQDWATHEIGNELSALYDVPHGATISIIMGAWMRYVYKKKPFRFCRYAKEVFDVKSENRSDEEIAYEGILRTEEFFRGLGMPTSFKDFDIPTNGIEDMLDRIAFRGTDDRIGGIVRLNRDDCRAIYTAAFENNEQQ